MNEQELNKKLAEWAGLKAFEDGLGIVFEFDRKLHKEPPAFTQSLDACFRWLVPKLQDYTIAKSLNGGHNAAIHISGRWSGVEHNDNPALALCLAIEKLIDKEEK